MTESIKIRYLSRKNYEGGDYLFNFTHNCKDSEEEN